MLHIGWQKCASTLLQQEIYRRAPSSWHINRVVFNQHNLILDAIQEKGHVKYVIKSVCDALEQQKKTLGNRCFHISDERISQWRGRHATRIVSESETYAYQELWAEILFKVFPERKILIIYRQPEGWLRSLYAQDVKCGAALAHLPFEEWCEGNRAHLIAATNIERLYQTYRRHFGKENVIIFPYELFISDKSKVTGIMKKEFGFNVDVNFFNVKSNASLPDYAIELMRHIHIAIQHMADGMQIPPEKTRNLRDHLFWFINYGSEHSDNFSSYMAKDFPVMIRNNFSVNGFDVQKLHVNGTVPEDMLKIMRSQYRNVTQMYCL